MRKILIFLFISLFILSFQGCMETHNKEVIKGEVIRMQVGQTYNVTLEDKLIEHNSNTKISILNTLNDGSKDVTLLNGVATLIKTKI